VISRNVCTGGGEFDNIQSGSYYLVISIFMGGTVRVNFSPSS